MYIARRGSGANLRFQLRESFRPSANTFLTSRHLFDLGAHPDRYLRYPGERSILFDEKLLHRLHSLGLQVTHEKLETLFLPFIRKDIREFLEFHLARARKPPPPLSTEEERCIRNELHPFDKRRYLALRSGPGSAQAVSRAPLKFFRRLLGKSRDELEQYFLAMEAELGEAQLKEYVCAVFDVGRSLPPFFRWRLEAVEEQRLDELFLVAFREVEKDTMFWAGLDDGKLKLEYLSRYAIMFFDHSFHHDALLEQLIRESMERRKRPPPPSSSSPISPEEVEELIGLPLAQARQLSRRALTRLYRKRAKELHPDSGGGHEAFIRLNEIYRSLQEKH